MCKEEHSSVWWMGCICQFWMGCNTFQGPTRWHASLPAGDIVSLIGPYQCSTWYRNFKIGEKYPESNHLPLWLTLGIPTEKRSAEICSHFKRLPYRSRQAERLCHHARCKTECNGNHTHMGSPQKSCPWHCNTGFWRNFPRQKEETKGCPTRNGMMMNASNYAVSWNIFMILTSIDKRKSNKMPSQGRRKEITF